MNYFQLKRLASFIGGEALDESPVVRKHADGTPCKASSPDTCPETRKADQADDLSSGSNSGGDDSDLSAWDGYITLEDIRHDLSDPGDTLTDEEIEDVIEEYRGNDTPEEDAKNVMEALGEMANERYNEQMSKQYGGRRYDSYGAPNW